MFATIVVNICIVTAVLYAFWPQWGYVSAKLTDTDGKYRMALEKTRRLFPRPTLHLYLGSKGEWYNDMGELVDLPESMRVDEALDYAKVNGTIA